jgi:hypothetical protein
MSKQQSEDSEITGNTVKATQVTSNGSGVSSVSIFSSNKVVVFESPCSQIN